MSITTSPQSVSVFKGDQPPRGPVTKAVQRRAFSVYLMFVIIGLVPFLLGATPFWQAAGLGLWAPGAGFLYAGGWASILFPVTLVLFAASLLAWFWAGVVIAPIFVWLGAALVAGAMTNGSSGIVPYGSTALLLTGMVVFIRFKNAKKVVEQKQTFQWREKVMPASLAEVKKINAEPVDSQARELDEEQLESMRYLLDRSLQPLEAWDGFNIIDQYQPAALRYQLNHIGFALGIYQGSYAPNFSGYLGQAQRNLIEKYLLKKVWGYWVYESCWGNLNFTNFDPADKDNIMLTGWFGMQVGQYMINANDKRYVEPGSLSFKTRSNKPAFKHDFNSIIGSITMNYENYSSTFGLYPCEPNWIYPICNHYGMGALAAHDKVMETSYVDQFLPMMKEKLRTEFTDASGTYIGLRSKHLGIQFPFPSDHAGYVCFANIFDQEQAQRMWAISRKELEMEIITNEDGKPELKLPERGIDPGNYKPGNAYALGVYLSCAREFGDEHIAEAVQTALDRTCGLTVKNGTRTYVGGSNYANAWIAIGRIMQKGDFRKSFAIGPDPQTLKGPLLADVPYPDVLVARAYSQGEDLDLVLFPGRTGKDEALSTLKIERLVPNQTYIVSGVENISELISDDYGCTALDVVVKGRTHILLTLGA